MRGGMIGSTYRFGDHDTRCGAQLAQAVRMVARGTTHDGFLVTTKHARAPSRTGMAAEYWS
jgi:hypothetical protein